MRITDFTISPYELCGIEKGREEGREAGREEGREEGELRGKRDLVRRAARKLLGSVPDSLEASLSQVNSSEELDHLYDGVLDSYIQAQRSPKPPE